ncbi:hypothetical protein QE429_001423 [Bacillus sp. SORGH_AS 510]|uniref:GNAT family N-acetyltransferase n=1 Tax=Bacillus sp. SORGH_AS_0510 TaxID=3041771 RepID=UPI00278A3E34|nr:GNAT family N-acetyltransferase [Bacillus sp. SORGH_AS_0510]MDQ1144596.1 hypothetical protein [Bacillus sp. SORGH_AS_0510]
MYEVISYNQKSVWEEKLRTLSNKDIFYHHSYSNLYQCMGDGDPHLFFYEDERGNKVGYVFLKRKINDLPFANDLFDGEVYDIITPSYGYGGPLYDREDEQIVKQFREEFESYCQIENIICEFIRFHPLLQNQVFMGESVEASFDRETIYIDLTKSKEEIFNEHHKNHQRNIKKTIKNGMEFKIFKNEDALEVVEDFFQVYKETMDKLNASTYSYFSTQYIQDLLSQLKHHSMVGAVFYENQMVAASVCMYEGDSLHYHLGCSQKQFLHLGVNSYLLHKLALWGKDAGLVKFHLGGGHIGRDSLFQFKYRFNPNGLLPFYIGKKIHQPFKYDQLIQQWERFYGEQANEHFFPVYRSLPRKSVSNLT